MGEEVSAQSYTREQRQRYREKVRQNLDVFERMLSQSHFEFDRPMTGLEIELNLVDEHYQPRFANAEVLEEIADPGYQTELARYNIELNVQPRPCPRRRTRARGRAEGLAQQRRRGRAETRCAHRGRRNPAHDHAGALPGRVDQRQQPLHRAQRLDLLRPGRGHLPRHRGPTGERVATYCDSIAPESACTSVQLHLQVAPQDFAAHWNAAQALVAPSSRWRPTRRSSSGSGCTRRPGSSSSARPPTPAASS